MTSATGEIDRSSIDATISALDKREFLLHSTRANVPTRFSTRWAMSYLAGPLTRDQVKRLTGDRPADAAVPGGLEATPADSPAPELAEDETRVAPEVAADIEVCYLDAAAPWAAEVGAVTGGVRLTPALVARVRMLFDDTKADLRETVEWEAFVPVGDGDVDWGEAIAVDYDSRDLRREAPDGAAYVLTGAAIKNATWFRSATADLKNHLYREQTIALQANRGLKLYSRIDETSQAFVERCQDAANEAKDEETAKIRDRLAGKIDTIEVAIAKYDDRIEELQSDVRNRRNQDLISIGSSVLGSILGGRNSTTTIARSAGRAATRGRSSAQRIRTIENRIDEKNMTIEDLEADLQEAVAEIDEDWNENAAAIEPIEISLEKNDISVDEVSLLWLPVG